MPCDYCRNESDKRDRRGCCIACGAPRPHEGVGLLRPGALSGDGYNTIYSGNTNVLIGYSAGAKMSITQTRKEGTK